jgi:uncharacterized protein
VRHRFPLGNRIVGVSLCLCVLLISNATAAKETPIPAAPAQFVTDNAGFMSSGALQALNSQLEDYEKSSGHQLLVYIEQTTGGAPIEDWAVRAFANWKVGNKGIDDGLVLFIMSTDRKLRFEVGYGLEPVIPDSVANAIITDVIVPRIQAGNRDEAVTAGMDAVMTVIGGGGAPASPRQQRGRPERPMTLGQLIGFGIIGLIVLVILITNPSLAIYLLASILSGGGRGGGGDWGGGGGGGGFSGGGGRSGGGGATGSW